MVKFTIPLKPMGQPRPRFTTRGGFARAYEDKEVKEYKQAVGMFARPHFPEPFSGPVDIVCTFYLPRVKSRAIKHFGRASIKSLLRHFYPTVKPDFDNLEKIIGDSMNGIAFNDDQQVVNSRAFKRYTHNEGYIVVEVRELTLQDLDLQDPELTEEEQSYLKKLTPTNKK